MQVRVVLLFLGVLQFVQAAPVFGGFDIVDSNGQKHHVVSVSKTDINRLEERNCDVGCVQDCWRTVEGSLLVRCADYCGCKELIRSSAPAETEPVAEEQQTGTENRKKRKPSSTPSEKPDVPASKEAVPEGRKKRRSSSPQESAPTKHMKPQSKYICDDGMIWVRGSSPSGESTAEETTTPAQKLQRSTPPKDAPASEPISAKTQRSAAPPGPKPDEPTDIPTEESAEPTAAFSQCSSDCLSVCGTRPSCIASCQSHFCKTSDGGSLWTGLLSAIVGAAIVTAFYLSYRRMVMQKKPERLLGESLVIRSSS